MIDKVNRNIRYWWTIFWENAELYNSEVYKQKWLPSLYWAAVECFRMRKQSKCTHDWVDDHNGSRCRKCGLVYPDGTAPWLPLEIDEEHG